MGKNDISIFMVDCRRCTFLTPPSQTGGPSLQQQESPVLLQPQHQRITMGAAARHGQRNAQKLHGPVPHGQPAARRRRQPKPGRQNTMRPSTGQTSRFSTPGLMARSEDHPLQRRSDGYHPRSRAADQKWSDESRRSGDDGERLQFC